MQLGAGLAIAGATVALRAGDAVTGGGQAAFTVAFCLLALVAAGCAVEALRLDPAAGNAARRPRAAAAPAPSAPSGQAGTAGACRAAARAGRCRLSPARACLGGASPAG